jgi:hypothetical protein
MRHLPYPPPKDASSLSPHLDVLGEYEELVGVHGGDAADLALHRAGVPHRLHHVARARLALGPQHRRALGHAALATRQPRDVRGICL